jgi:sterol desaturase/sphingolipid hydroxylase (fatty acid hydroxylase superfamily)
MNWGAYFTLAVLSTIKFMFAPVAGLKLKLSFLETYLSCVSGALICAVVFYFGANFFMLRAQNKRLIKYRKSVEQGTPIKRKKNFTRVNKTIVRVKRSIGIIGISLWAPFFLSVPLGSIVVAKFYHKKKMAFPLILIGIFINGFVSTFITYLF